MRTYDTYLFIEIIESIKGILFLREENRQGVRARFYQGVTGKLVIVECSDEDLTEQQASGYLDRLGIGHLIPSLFPPIKPSPVQEAEEIIKDRESAAN